MSMRVGNGFDAHRFKPGARLVLGGVVIDFEMGLEAHSDGDVIIHALCDAILGALCAGDIGQHFPDSSEAYRGIDSRNLLRKVIEMTVAQGYRLGNADITVIAQVPKLAPHIKAMRENLAQDCQVAMDCMSIKATTTEKMGFTGREEGIAATAGVLLIRGNE